MNNMQKNHQKVVVAMSGGVDSSVAAAMLKNQGYDIVGVFMLFWAESSIASERENKCCSIEAQEDARKVAKKLGIPFYVLDFANVFRRQIVNYFLKQYASGRTPNPCIECNRWIKFDLLLKKALGMGADYIATGHYVRLRREIRNPKSEIRNYKYKLFRARDSQKDQSYFLYTLGQKQLKYALFPLGDYTKPEVRKLADKWGLPYRKRESQEICFIPEKNHNEFLKRYLKLESGKIVCGGKIIGEHKGLPLYTIGQRKEIKLSGGPYWVIGFDFKKNLLKVTDVPNDPLLYRENLEAQKVNWISGKEPKLPLKTKVKIRYRHPAVAAVIKQIKSKKVYQVKLNQPQRAVTPGQSVVFYKNDELLGGGIIAE